MQKSTIRFVMTDILSPLTLLIAGGVMFYLPNTISPQLNRMFVNLGDIFVFGGLVLMSVSLFERLTKCKLCKNDSRHTLPECIHERLFPKGVEQ